MQAFAQEIRSSGQTLPFDTGQAVATLLTRNGILFVGVSAKLPVASVQLVDHAGNLISVLSNSHRPPTIPGSHSNSWYEVGEPVDGGVFLLLTTS